MGSKETGGMDKLKTHGFFSRYNYETKWGNLLNQPSPLPVKSQLCSRPKLTDDEVKFLFLSLSYDMYIFVFLSFVLNSCR